MKQLLYFLFALFLFPESVLPALYYSQGSFPPEVLSSWNSIRTGGGQTPLNFSSGDLFIIQSDHTMTTLSNWSISGTGSCLWIETGGMLIADFPVTLAKATTFQIDDGATCIHNNTGAPSSTIFNGTESFNANSTFWIKNWAGNLYAIPYGISWGNLIIDVPTLGGSWNQVGNVFSVNGTLDIRQTGGGDNEFRLCSRSALTYNFNFNRISVSGGILAIEKGGTAGLPSMNTVVTGDLLITGGKLDLGAHGTSTLSFGGNLTISGTGKMIQSGATSRMVFSATGAQQVVLSPDGINTSLIITDINSGSVVEMNSDWVMNHLSTLNIYGTLNMNGFLLRPRAVNVGGILNFNGGALDQIGTAAIITGGPSLGNTGIINCDGVMKLSATSFSSVLIQPGGTINLDNGVIQMNHDGAACFVDTGGALFCGSGKVVSINQSVSTFILNPGGILGIGSPEGIELNGMTGNIQVGGQRNFHYDADYCYHSTVSQLTGNGLPATVKNLTIDNESGVTLTNDVEISGKLMLLTGNILSNSRTISYGPSGTLEYNGISYSSTSDVEFPLMIGPGSLVVTRAAISGLVLHDDRILLSDLSIGQDAKFIVPEGVCLTVQGETTLSGNDCLVIRSGGSFIDNGAFMPGSGTAMVERSVVSGGWHYISPPVENAVSGIFTGDYLKQYIEGTAGFGPAISSTTMSLIPVTGYALWPTSDHTIFFTGGKTNTGEQEAVVFRSFTGQPTGDGYDGWNLVGNPYPSAIDLDQVTGLWENVEETAYFWDSSLGSGNYTTYPLKSGLGTHSQFVPPAQAFFVYCNAPAATSVPGTGMVRFNNSSRVHSTEPFLKDANYFTETVSLKVTGTSMPYSDELIIRFDPLSTTGYDPGYDAYKLWGMQEAPQLYSLTEQDQKKISVNLLPFNRENICIPVCFRAGVTGSYTLSFEGLETFREEVTIFLEDQKLQKKTDLKQNPEYVFSSDVNDVPERFLIWFNNPRLGITQEEQAFPFGLWYHNGEVVIRQDSDDFFVEAVFLYDLTGRKLKHSASGNGRIVTIKTDYKGGWFLVKVISNMGVFSKLIYSQ